MKKSKLKAKIEELEFKNNQLLKSNAYLIKNNLELKKNNDLIVRFSNINIVNKLSESQGFKITYHV